MLKIYINQLPLILASEEEAQSYLPGDKENLVARYSGQHRSLFHYIDNLEKSTRLQSIVLYHSSFEKLKTDFFNIYKVIEAGGGVVFNNHGEILMIYRLGHWDLPKGKIEKGETKELAAIREVQEETGIENISLKEVLLTTYHTYRNRKNKRCLKVSYWYKMFTTDTVLTPQAEEDIEKAEWIKKEDFLKANKKAYRNIYEVLEMV